MWCIQFKSNNLILLCPKPNHPQIWYVQFHLHRNWKRMLKLVLQLNWCDAHWIISIVWRPIYSKGFGQSWENSIWNSYYLQLDIPAAIEYVFTTIFAQISHCKHAIDGIFFSISDSHLPLQSTVWTWNKIREFLCRIFGRRFFLLLSTATIFSVLHCMHHWNFMATYSTIQAPKVCNYSENRCAAIS